MASCLAAVAGFTLQWVATRRDRARLAAENAELYPNNGNAVTLQHSLLPGAARRHPDVEVVARYEPAVERTEVGGDWYDAMPVPGGSLFVVVGDVSGHGIKAATTMASLRFAAHTYTADGCDPRSSSPSSACCSTCATARSSPPSSPAARCGPLEVDRGRRRHPSPVLVDADGARFVEVPHGPPIGVPNGDYKQVEFDVADEGTLVAFTDGLVERRGERIDDGLDRSARRHPDHRWQPGRPHPILADTATHAGHDDDLAILGVRWTTTTRA